MYRPPEEHLVSGRLRQLQSRGNPLVAQARADALRRANARGDVNASYAAGSAENAAIQAMLPVAQQDADILTRVNIQNANAIQQAQQAELALRAQMGNEAVGATLAAAQRDIAQAERDQALQMQRERLAFEGEQAGYGREHDFAMLERNLGRELTLSERQFMQDMARAEQGFGFQRQLQEDAYGQDIGRMGYEWDMQRDLVNQRGDWEARGRLMDYEFGNRISMQQFAYGMLTNIFSNPDQFGDPQAVDGMLRYLFGSEPGSFTASFFDSILGPR